MATATKIFISPEIRGNFHLGHDAEAAKRASELLQYDMDNFHALFHGPRHSKYEFFVPHIQIAAGLQHYGTMLIKQRLFQTT